jgi:hypothetical protein
MIKKIFISPYSMGYFSAFQKIDTISTFRIYAPDIRFNTFLYSSLIQTGADLIEVIDDPHKLFGESRTINQRVLESDKNSYLKLSETIHIFFNKYIKRITKNKILSSSLMNAEMLTTDLLYSVGRGSDFIFSGEIPDLLPYKALLQPEFYYPLQNLLSCIGSHDLFIPSPISTISKLEVDKFNSLIKSDIYSEYSEKHKLLNGNSINLIANSIKISAEKLVASNPYTLGLYNNLTSFISISKLVNPKLGEIAGIVNDSLTNSSRNNNVIIYRYKDITLDAFKTKFDISMSRLEDDMLKWLKEAVILAKERKISKTSFFPFIKKYIIQNKDKKLKKSK